MEKLNKIDIDAKIQGYEYSKLPKLSKAKKSNLSQEDKKQIEKAARDSNQCLCI